MDNRPIFFTRGVPPAEAFPVAQLRACQEAVLGSGAAQVLQYGHQAGYGPLRELVAQEYGVSVPEVMVSNGSLQIQDLLAGCLVQPGSRVITEQPSYDRTIATFRRHGARVVGVPLEHDGLNIERLEALIKREGAPVLLYVVPDFQNPSGTTMSLAKRRAVLELAERYDFWVLEDVPYRKLRYRGEELPLLRELNAERVVTLSSYSKLMSPGLRVGYAVGPAALMQQLVALAEAVYLAPVLPTQAVVCEFMRRGYLEPHIEKLCALYRPKWQAAVAACGKYLPEAQMTEPDGGFFVGVTLPAGARVDTLVGRGKEVGLMLTPGTAFFADPDEAGGPDGARFVRLPFCALTPVEIEEGVRRLAMLL